MPLLANNGEPVIGVDAGPMMAPDCGLGRVLLLLAGSPMGLVTLGLMLDA